MTICIGRPIIEALARDGAWTSESGESAVAASDLFGRDPYVEIERLRAEIAAMKSSIDKCQRIHGEDSACEYA
jgi:hypothetical protein